MAGPNPLINLGSLNRLFGTVEFPDFPSLNITAPFLTKSGIRFAVSGDTTLMLPQMVSQVQSQEVYLSGSLIIGLVKTTPLASAFKKKIETDSNMGNGVTFRSDASQLPPFVLENCAVEGFEGVGADGTDAGFPIRVNGTWYVNSNLWNLLTA